MERETLRNRRLTALAPYAVACALVALGLWLELVITPVAGSEAQFLPFSLAVAVSIWYGGLAPGVLAIALAWVASDYFLLGPGILLRVDDRSQTFTLIGFVFGWLGVGLLVHRSRLQMQRHRDALPVFTGNSQLTTGNSSYSRTPSRSCSRRMTNFCPSTSTSVPLYLP